MLVIIITTNLDVPEKETQENHSHNYLTPLEVGDMINKLFHDINTFRYQWIFAVIYTNFK